MLISGRKMFWPTSTRDALALTVTSGDTFPKRWRNTRCLTALPLQEIKGFPEL